MATKYQVFISSTFEDLKEERDQVIKAVLEMGHIPVGMEMFSAADEEQWKIIQRHIDESDYYVVIVAHRLGSLTEGISYTRKEYEYAAGIGVPVLGFLLDEDAPWPADKVDKDSTIVGMLDNFKSLVRTKPVSFWKSADDLYGRFSVALSKAITTNPRDGWVRASEIVGPEVTAELSRLSSENAALRKELDDRKAKSEADHAAEVEELLNQMGQAPLELSYKYADDSIWVEAKGYEHDTGFALLASNMVIETTVTSAMEQLAFHLREDEDRPPRYVAKNQVRDLFATWASLGLVEPSSRRHPVSDNEEYWTLSQLGREVQALLLRRLWIANLAKARDPEMEAIEAPSDPEDESEPDRSQVKVSAPTGII